MNFIKRVFDGDIDYPVHLQFQKFGRGGFRDRALIKAKRSGEKYTITTSAEFANEFVEKVAEKLGKNKTKITGAIISTIDLSNELDFKDKKQFQGVKRYIIDKEMSGEEILALLNKFPKAFFALSFGTGNTSIKIKPKAPKSGKPGNKQDEKPKADFCKLITSDKEIAGSFVFEKPDFKQAEITHTFIIDEIIIPDELKQSKNFARMREEAKRKGKIIREAVIDGKVMKQEKGFVA